jgi:hypothetical protein
MENNQIRPLSEHHQNIINSFNNFDEEFTQEFHSNWRNQRINYLKKIDVYSKREELIISFFNITDGFIEYLISLNKSVLNYKATRERKDLNPINRNYYYGCLNCLNAIYQFKEIIEFNVLKKHYEIAYDLKSTILILLNDFKTNVYSFIRDKSIFEIQFKDLINYIESSSVPSITVNITNKDNPSHDGQTKNSILSNDEIIEHPFKDENNFKLFKYFVNNWKQSNTELSRYTYFFNFFREREKPKPKEHFSEKDFFSFVKRFKNIEISLRKQKNAIRTSYDDYLQHLESEFNELKKE